MRIQGTIAPMLTPVTEARDIDTKALRDFTDFLVEGGVHGLLPTGTTGEFTSLTRQQRQTVIRTVVEQSGELPVLAGCGGTCIQEVNEYIADAADVDASAAVVITPYYMDISQAGLQRFYEQVARESPLPIYLYNIPQFTGNGLEKTTVAELAEVSNIVGIKDSSGDFPFFMDLLEVTPPSFSVIQGIPTYSMLSLEQGADGLISGPANIFPNATSEIYEAYISDDYSRAQKRLSMVLLPILQAIRSMPTIPAFKYLSTKAGRDLGGPLPPLPDLTAEQRDRLDTCFETITTTGLIAAGD